MRGSIKGRRRRRQKEKATAGAGTGLRQREWMEGGGEGEGQRQDAEGETQGTEERGGERKEGEAVGKGFSRRVTAARRPVNKWRSKGTLDDKHRAWVGAVELLHEVLEGPLKNTNTPGHRGCLSA